jgi:hypothetical protein
LRLLSEVFHRGLYSGAGSILRWRVRHGLGRCHSMLSMQSQYCVLQGRHPPPSCGTLHAGSSSHTASFVRDILQDRNVSVLLWPANSPDRKPTEHVRDLLDRRVRARAIPCRNVRELAGALVEECGNISQKELANVVQSMRRRCTAVLIFLVSGDSIFTSG